MSTRPRWSKAELRQLFLITIIFIGACIETDIYLPAFPDMMAYFQVSAAQIQNLLAWNFIALCVSGPIYGPVADAIGRKRPLAFALFLFLLGSLLTIVSDSFTGVLIGRILQGFGSGGCFVLGSTIIFDCFKEEKAMLALNQLNLFIPVMVGSAPLIGGFLNSHFGFKSNFIAIGAVVLLSWILFLVWFEETHPVEQRKVLSRVQLWKDYRTIMSSVSFWQLNVVVSLLFTGYMLFLSFISVFFVLELGVSKAAFPYFQGSVISGWMSASFLSHWAVRKWSTEGLKRIGCWVWVSSIISVFLALVLAPRNPYLMTIAMAGYAFGYEWVQTPYFTEIMNLMPDLKGLVSSLVTSLRLFLTSTIVAIVAHFYDGTVLSFAVGLACVAAVIMPILWVRERRSVLT